MILIVFCAFCSQGSAKSFVSPQLPYSGRRRTGDPAVPGGREPHRLVERGKNHGFPSFLQFQRVEGGCQLWVPALPPKLGTWLRAESTKPASDQGLPVFNTVTAVTCRFCTALEKWKCSAQVKPWHDVDIVDSNNVTWGCCSVYYFYFNPFCMWWTFPLQLY